MSPYLLIQAPKLATSGMTNPKPIILTAFPPMSLANTVGHLRGVRKGSIAPPKEECIFPFFKKKIEEERGHVESERPHLYSVTSVKIILANSSAEFGLLVHLNHLKLSIHIVKFRIWGKHILQYFSNK